MGKRKCDLSPAVLKEKKEKEENDGFGWNLDAALDSSQEHRNLCAAIAM